MNSFNGNSGGLQTTNLLSFRSSISIGDPEIKDYHEARKINYFGKRKGVTIAYSWAGQGATSLWDENDLYCIDWLANYGSFNISGEYAGLFRSFNGEATRSKTWFVRGGYNFKMDQKDVEIVYTYMKFDGPMDQKQQEIAQTLN